MARMTKKYSVGVALAKAKGLIKPREVLDHDTLYGVLERAAYHWDSGSGEWLEGKPAPSSMFGDDDEGSGIYRIRAMAHPGEIDPFVRKIVESLKASGYRVGEISGQYPNRRGVGVRVYITLMEGT